MTKIWWRMAWLLSIMMPAAWLYADPGAPTGVQAFAYYAETESFTNVAAVPTPGQWSRVTGATLGGAAIRDESPGASTPATYTLHVPTNGTYSLWIAHLTDTNQLTTFTCTVEQGGATVTNLTYAPVRASVSRSDTNYVYRPNSWQAWSRGAMTLTKGQVTLKLAHHAAATLPAVVDAIQILGESESIPDWEETGSKPFSYYVEAETFDGGTNAPLYADGSYNWVTDWWNIIDYIYSLGGRAAVALSANTHPLTHTFSVPKAGTYYLWMNHGVNPSYLMPVTCVVQQNGLTVTNIVFGPHKPSNDRDDPDYIFRPGFWSVWSKHPATLAPGPVTLKVYYNDPGIQTAGSWDCMQIVDDPDYRPGFSPLARTDVPDFRFRFRIDSIMAPSAPSNTAWYLVNYYYPMSFWVTNYQWSAWLSVTGDLKQALLDSYPNSYSGIWPFTANFILYPYTVTNMTLSVEWETALRQGSYTGTYASANFSLLVWRNSPVPLPHQCGPSSEFNQRYIRQAAGLTTNDVPTRFPMIDRFMGVDYEEKAWSEGLDFLHRLGMNTISTEGNPTGKSLLNKLGLTKTGFAVYVPPYMFDTDLSQTTDAAMDTWAQGQASAVTNAGYAVTDVGWYGMSDEPGWYDPYMYTHSGPDLPGVFRTYLQNKGFLAADFGAADWSAVEFFGRGSATTLPAKRLHYWTQRFFAENSADVYSRYVRAMERAFYPGMLMSVNWNNFGGRYYTPGPFGWNPDTTSPDAATGGHDWIDFGRHRGVTGLWTEDWFSDDYARLWSYYSSKMRSGANKYNDSRTNNAPPAIGFGGYIVGGLTGGKTGGTLQKMLAILGHGGKAIYFYVFGPEYVFPGNCYSENYKFYPEAADAMRVVGKAEDLMYPGQPVRAQVAILSAQAAQVWDRKEVSVPTDVSFQGVNSYVPDWQAESYNLYSALQDSHIPADWVDEVDLESGSLSQFKVIYVTTPNLSSNAVLNLQSWINAGGVAVFTAGAAQFDQYDETNTLINATLGITAAPHNRLYWPASTNKLGSITSSVGGLSSFYATGLAQTLSNTTATVQARFASSNLPAITMNSVGSGKAIVFGTFVGTAYEQGGQAVARGWVAWPVTTVAGVTLPVDFNAPKVEAATLSSTNGLAVTLLNWTNSVANLIVTTRVSSTIFAVRSAKLGADLAFSQNGNLVTFTLPSLGPADVVKLYTTISSADALAASTVSGSQIQLAWTDNSFNETGFHIERSLDGSTGWVLAGTTAANATTFTDANLLPYTLYYYRVRGFNGGGDASPSNVASARTLNDVILDNADTNGVTIAGSWSLLSSAGAYGPDLLHDGNASKGAKSVVFTPTLTVTTNYDVYLRWSADPNRDTAVPVDIEHANATSPARVWVNQQLNGATWVRLGTFQLNAGTAGSVAIRTEGTTGYVIADAVRWTVSTNTLAAVPAAPTNLTATAVSGSRINLGWTDQSANEAGFKIERSTNGVSYALAGYAGAGATSFADTTVLPAQLYYYRVRAYNGGGDSAPSNVASATTINEIIVDNADPTGVAVAGSWTLAAPGGTYGPNQLTDGNAGKGTKSVTFTPTIPLTGNYEVYGRWTAFANRATNATFEVNHALGTATTWVNQQLNGGGWTLLGVFRFNAGTGGTVVIRNAGTDGYVVADAVRFYGTASALPSTPAAPSGLVASPVSGSQINLSWTDNATTEWGYKVERSTDNVTYTPIAVIGPGATGSSDTGLTVATLYYYRVCAYNNAGNSGYSNVGSATTVLDYIVDNADPTGVLLTGAWTVSAPGGTYGPNQVHDGNSGKGAKAVQFTPPLPAAGNYEVYARWTAQANRDPNVPIDVVHSYGSARVWVNQQLNGSVWVWLGTYRLEAGAVDNLTVRNDLTSGFVIADAARFTATTNPLPALPAAPSGLTATGAGSNRINLAWIDVATNELGYKIERSADGSSFSQVALVGSNSTSYGDSGLGGGLPYWYRVRAYNSRGDSGYSGVATASTLLEDIVDNLESNRVVYVGDWAVVAPGGTYGPNQVHDGGAGKGAKSVTFIPTAPVTGNYDLFARWTATSNRATNAPIDIAHANGTGRVWVNQQVNGGAWYKLGTYRFNAGTNGTVSVRNDGTEGWFVIADAVRILSTAASLPGLPGAPSGLTATTVASNRVELSWADGATNELGFKLERSVDSVNYQPLTQLGSNATSYADTGVTPGNAYWYRVRAYNGGGDSAWSGVASAQPLIEVIVDNLESNRVSYVGVWTVVAPGGTYGPNQVHDGNAGKGAKSVTYAPAVASAGLYDVYVRWTASSNRATNAPVEVVHSNGVATVWVNQQVNGGVWFKVGTFRFNAGTNGTVAVRNDGTDGYVVADAVRLASSAATLPAVPAAPGGLVAAGSSGSAITLGWSDVATNELGYKIERSTDGVSFAPVAAVGSNVTGYVDGGRVPATTYYYRVRAYNGGGDSGYTGPASATVLTEVVVDNADGSGVTIVGSWTVAAPGGTWGPNQLHDGNAGKGAKSVRFTPTLAAGGTYQVYLRWTAYPNRATNVPVDIAYAGGTATVSVNQQLNGGVWVLLGTYSFNAGSAGNVLIRTDGTDGYVIADAVRWVQTAGSAPAIASAMSGGSGGLAAISPTGRGEAAAPTTALSLAGISLGDTTGAIIVAGAGTIELTGTGLGIDQGSAYLAAQSVTGDFEMTARIESVTGPNESVAGIMLREGLDSNARFVALAGTLTDQYWAAWYRTADESVQILTPATSLSYPNCWVGLVRRGDTVSLHTSADGQNWIEETTITIPDLSLTLDIGLFVTSGIPGADADATATGFSIRPLE